MFIRRYKVQNTAVFKQVIGLFEIIDGVRHVFKNRIRKYKGILFCFGESGKIFCNNFKCRIFFLQDFSSASEGSCADICHPPPVFAIYLHINA